MVNNKEILIASPTLVEKINEIEGKLDKLLTLVSKSSCDPDEFVTGAEARKLLNVSASTWQAIRDQKRIPFSQIGRKIYVKRSDIINYLDSHIINK